MFIQTRIVPTEAGYEVDVQDARGATVEWLGPFPTRYQARTAANQYELEHSDVVEPRPAEDEAKKVPCTVGGVVYDSHDFPFWWSVRDDGYRERSCWRCGLKVEEPVYDA